MTSRLKKLELHGYKTFASRTLFEFPGRITAVVGPNGSGKSNIADSLRWVLGEQSYSLLRGRKTEDMIFSGSEFRPRAGMASAAIVFDNEDGWLPIDFSEVEITRRAYRDGNNEYLLNGQRVRLKEISELLAQSGLAERTYTIIGQGLVDAALSLKPDERRRFFEEAAGIGLYRSRREESLNRLDQTRRNLERVLDILSELEPRLKSLEKQAQRAIEYDRIMADLRVSLREWYGFHWHRVQRDLSQTRETVRAQETRLGQAREKLSGVEGKLNAVRAQLQQVRDQLNGWHGQSAELHNQRERVSRGLAVLDERQRALVEQSNTLEADLAHQEEEEKSRQNRLDGLILEEERLQTELADARSQVEAARKALSARQREREAIEQKLRDARRQMAGAETRQVQFKAHQDELQNRVANLQRNREGLLKTIETLENTLHQAQVKQSQAKGDRDRSETNLHAAEETQQQHQQRLGELEANRKRYQDQRAHFETERLRFAAQIDVLEQAERSMAGLNQGARMLLQAVNQKKLNGKFRALSGLLDVPAEYESAIAGALGEHLDAILIEAGTDPESALEYLEKNENGRAELLPIDWVKTPKDLADLKDEDLIGLASKLVNAPQELKPAVHLLLGQVLVSRSRAGARRLAANLPPYARVVTLKGEVFSGNGSIVAGREPRASVIGRPRQKRELQDALADAEKQLTEAKEAAQRFDEALARERSLQEEMDRAVRQAGQELNQSNQVLQQATLEHEQARQRRDFQRGQVSGLEDQIRRSDEELKQSGANLKKIVTEIESFNEQVREHSRALAGLPMDELQEQVSHWSTNAAVVERALKDTSRRLDEYQQAVDTGRNQQKALQQRKVELQTALGKLDQEKAQYHQDENRINAAIEALQQQIEPAEKALTGLEKQYSDLQGDQMAAQQGVSVADRYSTQAQLEMTRVSESIESLRRRIEEDFGLVALEYTGENVGPTPLPLDGMVQELPKVNELSPELEDTISRQRAQLRRLGAINPEAQAEYHSVKERYDFLTNQVGDLKKADQDLREVITELDELMRREFRKTFDAVAIEFKEMFTRLFGGGSAKLILTDAENVAETGIDIETRLPGKREQGLSLLSGGERSLTAVALIFSLLKVSPTPFCVMDEVDAMLDEANVGRFCDLLRELSETTQFIVITHNRNTVQTADVIYGITMGRDSASQMISLRLDELSEDMVH
ncbi:condensin subunit Smc [Longilinea arvoryzae]|uniref:Chromosome partition protein Smc n=1 Tax=Longilinea arvoryzae TaxID=360412 RepID=A0A0S7BBI4_9CHLR|nr:chromosome segregation protein SMC [Longilinea arvoryzae]GAP15031.1 condensin subunit Smc [Longilinea arvoryzae]